VAIKGVLRAVDRSDATHCEASYRGPLAPHIEGFTAKLTGEGYAQRTVRWKRTDLSRWLERHRLALADIKEAQLLQFQVARRRRLGKYARRNDRFTGRQSFRNASRRSCGRAAPYLPWCGGILATAFSVAFQRITYDSGSIDDALHDRLLLCTIGAERSQDYIE